MKKNKQKKTISGHVSILITYVIFFLLAIIIAAVSPTTHTGIWWIISLLVGNLLCLTFFIIGIKIIWKTTKLLLTFLKQPSASTKVISLIFSLLFALIGGIGVLFMILYYCFLLIFNT